MIDTNIWMKNENPEKPKKTKSWKTNKTNPNENETNQNQNQQPDPNNHYWFILFQVGWTDTTNKNEPD